MEQLQKKSVKEEAVSDILKRLNGFPYADALGILDTVQYKLREVATVTYCPAPQEDIR